MYLKPASINEQVLV